MKIEYTHNNETIISFLHLDIWINLLTKGRVVHVKPVKLISCPGNNSCPPDQLCHTMDYLVEDGSEPVHVNVTLIFMCGVHNYTKELTVPIT